MNIFFLIFVVVALVVETITIIYFLHGLRHYKYVGNTYIYVAIMFGLCLLASLAVNFKDGIGNFIVPASSAIFEAFKMLLLAFEKESINAIFTSDNTWEGLRIAFAIVYVLTSLISFAFLSMTVVLTFAKIFANSIARSKNARAENSDIHYIFTDAQVSVSVHLAEELIKEIDKEEEKKLMEQGIAPKKNAVTVFVTRSSLKTQEGTEFRDALVAKGIQVKAENFTTNLAEKIIKDYFPKYFKEKKPFNKNVYIYCMFSDDATSTLVANNFEAAIQKNETFIELKNKKALSKEELDKLNKFRIFVTYQDNDIDLIYNYSGKTMHIISTLSQYDMVSSEFLLENPITNFVDIKSLSCETNNRGMHVTFIGLGMINRPILEKMTHAYQLIGDNVNKVHYHILDRDADEKAKNCQNAFTDKDGALFLYSVDSACSGEDLFEYETIDRYIKSLADQEKAEKEDKSLKDEEKQHRFTKDGFELFIISLKNTNFDMKVAKDLRRALFKYFGEDRLAKTIIFLRIGEEEVAKRVLESDSTFIKQADANLLNGTLKVAAPCVAYGENALMPKFIADHYNKIIDVGIVSSYAYQIQDKEGFDLKDDDHDFLNIRQEWLQKDKADFIKNIAVAYGIETKITLLECPDLKTVIAKFGTVDATRYEKYDTNDVIIKLANLEHNRWLAATYFNEKSIPLDDDDNFAKFLALNTGYNDNSGKDLKSKSDNKTRHACMVSNQRLRKLYDVCKANGYSKGGIKLVFLNDIKPIQKYFELIYNRQEEENKLANNK